MTDIQMDARKLGFLICFRLQKDNTLVLECNICSSDDYVFSHKVADIGRATAFEDDWIQRAVVHFQKHHPRELKA